MILLDGEMEIIMLEYDGGNRARILHEDTGKEWWVDISRLSFLDESPEEPDDGTGIVLLPHTTAQLEGLATVMRYAEAEFLGQFETAECPYCGEEAFVTPLGRVVCSCCTNPAEEICEDLKTQEGGKA